VIRRLLILIFIQPTTIKETLSGKIIYC